MLFNHPSEEMRSNERSLKPESTKFISGRVEIKDGAIVSDFFCVVVADILAWPNAFPWGSGPRGSDQDCGPTRTNKNSASQTQLTVSDQSDSALTDEAAVWLLSSSDGEQRVFLPQDAETSGMVCVHQAVICSLETQTSLHHLYHHPHEMSVVQYWADIIRIADRILRKLY